MLRRHNVNLEYIEADKTFRLNIDGYTTYLTQDDLYQLAGYIAEENHNEQKVADFLKEQYGASDTSGKQTVMDNLDIQAVIDVLKCQMSGYVQTQQPES